MTFVKRARASTYDLSRCTRLNYYYYLSPLPPYAMLVFRNLDCLSLVVYSNTVEMKLQTVFFLIFSKLCASKSGVQLN